MTDANVRFHGLDYKETDPAVASRFSFACPRTAKRRCSGLLIAGRTDIPRDGQGNNGGAPQWDFDGNAHAPTFHPSINCKGCWHGFIQKGRCVNVAKIDEPDPAGR
jgi:hypothetical protein